MPLPRYTYTGPIDHTVPPNLEKVRGKSVIITGGANGMGEVCVREFAAAGAFVTFADLNDARGKAIEAELNANGPRCVFVKCDIRDWDQQKVMFETAKTKSPCNSVDIVIANAGISRSSGDSLWNLDGESVSSVAAFLLRFGVITSGLEYPQFTHMYGLPSVDPNGEPTKPNLNIVRVNIDGTFYTWRLAVHYFRKQPDTEERDRCFIITGSMVAYIDSPVCPSPCLLFCTHTLSCRLGAPILTQSVYFRETGSTPPPSTVSGDS